MQPLRARSSPAQGPLDGAPRVPQSARAVAPGLGEGRSPLLAHGYLPRA